MSARQYKPFTHKYKNIPLIIYPVKDENPLVDIFEKKEGSIQLHLDRLYKKNDSLLKKGNYHILFVWNLNGKRMTDVWLYDMKNWSDSGPLAECITFRDLKICKDAGIASGDSLIALGREEELSRRIKDLNRYVERSKCVPDFPKGMEPKESFY
jgi:hypothetical protein